MNWGIYVSSKDNSEKKIVCARFIESKGAGFSGTQWKISL